MCIRDSLASMRTAALHQGEVAMRVKLSKEARNLEAELQWLSATAAEKTQVLSKELSEMEDEIARVRATLEAERESAPNDEVCQKLMADIQRLESEIREKEKAYAEAADEVERRVEAQAQLQQSLLETQALREEEEARAKAKEAEVEWLRLQNAELIAAVEEREHEIRMLDGKADALQARVDASKCMAVQLVDKLIGEEKDKANLDRLRAVSYTHLRAHETPEHLVCRLLLEKKKKNP
eukprot:TRINITY_DN18131_c0_g2_i1.p1 TRINITY_DN18131_c0_g2~~TRINITY_DN18131_c0_g2_i1.p1  ORF type:complete len:238 (-),score=97.67 TRINITY_DN18131_c0_g2_i1:12-725(-)